MSRTSPLQRLRARLVRLLASRRGAHDQPHIEPGYSSDDAARAAELIRLRGWTETRRKD